MKKARILAGVPWIVALACLVGLAASLSELHRLKTRFAEVSHHSFQDHAEVRRFMIAAKLAEADRPVVVFGDSITEMADLPATLCGRAVINAGIGGMTTLEATSAAAHLFKARPPYLIALAFGANDVGNPALQRSYSELAREANTLTERVVSISDTPDTATENAIARASKDAGLPHVAPSIPGSLKMRDGIHFTAAAYQIWLPALEDEIVQQCA
jgi:lysophospholipase L1-like esterase